MSGAAKRILVVDDDPEVLDVIQVALKSEGYQVAVARTGPDGLEAALADPPDVLILDIMMPGMHGADVCRRLKAEPTTAAVPIIMVTALSEAKYRKAALFQLDVDFYLTKPFDIADLLDKVHQAIRFKRIN